MTKSTTAANWKKIPRHQVEPPLADLIDAAADTMAKTEPGLGVVITEGARTHERQRLLKQIGASRTLHSRHIPDLSPTKRALAVDVAITVNRQVRGDWPLYEKFAAYVKLEAARRGVRVTWGGDWTKYPDGPHFQIDV